MLYGLVYNFDCNNKLCSVQQVFPVFLYYIIGIGIDKIASLMNEISVTQNKNGYVGYISTDDCIIFSFPIEQG